MSRNLSASYSCYEGSGLNTSFVSLHYWHSVQDNERSAALVTAIFALVFAIIGVPTNLLILVSMLWQRLYRETTYILLLNLTVASLLVCVMVMPFTVVSGFAGGFIFGGDDWTRCKVCQIGIMFTCLSLLSIHILALMAIDRWVFITYPFKYSIIMSKRNVGIAVALLWMMCIVMSILPLFGFGDMHYNFPVATCHLYLNGNTSVTENRNYGMLIMIENLLIPLPILVVTNCSIVVTIVKNLKKIYKTKECLGCSQEEMVKNFLKDNEKVKLRKQLHLIKVFGGTLVAHVITSVPVNIYILQALISGDSFPPAALAFLFLRFLSYPVIHSFMQACLIPELRGVQINIIFYFISCCISSSSSQFSTMSEGQRNCRCSNINCVCKCKKTKQFVNLLCLATLPAANSVKENTHSM